MSDMINVQKYYERLHQTNSNIVKKRPLNFLKKQSNDIAPLTWILDLKQIAKAGDTIIDDPDSLALEEFLLQSHGCNVSMLKLDQIVTVFNLIKTENILFYSPINSVLFSSPNPDMKKDGDFFVMAFPILEIHKYDLPGINPMISSTLRKEMDRFFGYDHVFTLFNVVDIFYAPWTSRQNAKVYDILVEKSSQAGAFKPLFKEQYHLSEL